MCSVFRISILLFFVPFASQAATSHARPVHTKPIVYSRNAYAASVISVFSPATIAAGSTSRLQVTFHNLGAAPWYTSGNSYVSLYHWNPHTKLQTVSPFATNGWRTTQQPTVLRKTTLHGQDVTFDVPLRAPTVPGTYHESFILAAEHVAWIKLSPFTIDLQVTPSTFTDSVVNTNSLPTPALVASTSPTSNAPIATAPPTFPSDNSWSAEVVSKGGMEWQIDPQSSASVEFTFKNTGMHTWYSDGKNFISLYATSSTHERSSPFAASSWIGPTHVARLKESSVAPGQIGHVDLTLQAPADPGQFSETFTLAAENTSWIQGSSVSLPILVPATLDFIASGIPNDVDIDAQPQTTPSTSQTSGLYVSTRVLSSADRVALAGNRRQGLSFAFKNTGTATWTSLSVRVKILSNADITTAALVHDPSWYSSSQPVYLLGTTYPGQVGYVAFQVKAPTLKGTYQAHFQLYANEQPVDGGEIDIPVSVTADGRPIPSQPSQPSAPSTPSPSLPILTPSAPIVPPQPLNGNLAALLAEPIIRVGIYTPTDDQMVVRAMSVPVIVSINNAEVCRFQPGQLVTVRFDRTTNLYQLTSGPCSGSSSQVYRFQTEDQVSPVAVDDYSHTLSWLPGANDNTFRDEVELRYASASHATWVINELPIEWYLKGIGETSNPSPTEFQKALLTAARTYALYHVQRETKHAAEDFTVDATYDQVYRGYGAEARDPNVVAAIDATHGQIVTYNGKLAITPYYSRSDGRTRSWTEVWGGGPYPWLVSVPVPWDNGKTLWGHGVGMSASGALGMARDGKNYQEILSYFYQQTVLMQAYK